MLYEEKGNCESVEEYIEVQTVKKFSSNDEFPEEVVPFSPSPDDHPKKHKPKHKQRHKQKEEARKTPGSDTDGYKEEDDDFSED